MLITFSNQALDHFLELVVDAGVTSNIIRVCRLAQFADWLPFIYARTRGESSAECSPFVLSFTPVTIH